MHKQKLIETRGEEPTLLPGHAQETWRNVDFGLGAAPTPVDLTPRETDNYPSRPFAKFARLSIIVGFALFGIVLIIAFINFIKS